MSLNRNLCTPRNDVSDLIWMPSIPNPGLMIRNEIDWGGLERNAVVSIVDGGCGEKLNRETETSKLSTITGVLSGKSSKSSGVAGSIKIVIFAGPIASSWKFVLNISVAKAISTKKKLLVDMATVFKIPHYSLIHIDATFLKRPQAYSCTRDIQSFFLLPVIDWVHDCGCQCSKFKDRENRVYLFKSVLEPPKTIGLATGSAHSWIKAKVISEFAITYSECQMALEWRGLHRYQVHLETRCSRCTL